MRNAHDVMIVKLEVADTHCVNFILLYATAAAAALLLYSCTLSVTSQYQYRR